MRLRPVVLTLLALAALAAAGCGEKKDSLGPEGSKRIELMLDYFPNADHSPIYAAQAAGHFSQAGISVDIRQPTDPSAPLKQLAAGRVDLAISYEPEVLRARDQGLSVVAVGALVQRPLTSIISLPKAGIRRVKDLSGKTVGTAGIDYQSAYLQTILFDHGVTPSKVKERNVGFGFVPALLTGTGGRHARRLLELRGSGPQAARAQAADHPRGPGRRAHLRRAGAGGQRGRARPRRRHHPGVHRRALARGARPEGRSEPRDRRPAEGEQGPRSRRSSAPSLKATLPLFSPPKGKPYGYQDPGEWNRFADWMTENKLLKNTPDARNSYTNSLLPGAGL